MHDDSDHEGYDWNEGHPDHEGMMAVAQLHRIAKITKMMLGIVGKNDELEGWVQYKISRAYNDLSDVFTYIQFQAHDSWVDEDHLAYDEDEFEDSYEDELEDYEEKFVGQEDELDEAKKKKGGKGLWHNIWAKRRRGEKPAKPGQKGYPKTLKIESEEARKVIRAMIQKSIKG